MTGSPSFFLPLWAEIVVAFFALCGGLIALLGASGVLRLQTFFSRVHAPALITTAGIWCLMLATIVYFSFQAGKPALNVFLLGLFVAITAPVTTIFLMRAALFRARQRGEHVPRSVNMLQLATPKMAPEKDDEDEENEETEEAESPHAPEAVATSETPESSASTSQDGQDERHHPNAA